jgi:hypothetical protein
MTAVSDVLAAGNGGGSRAAAPSAVQDSAGGVRARGRAREGYASPSVLVNTFAGWGRQTWSDLRDAWWTPASLPTFRTAWADRKPDRDRVPGGNSALYHGWVVYNHTVGLAVPAVALLIVGALTPLLWIARHPARLLLAAVITTALIALVLN